MRRSAWRKLLTCHTGAKKTASKLLIVDFRKTQQHQGTYTPLGINGTVGRVSSFRYLGVHITEDLTCTTQIDTLVRKAKQRLYHLRQLRKF